MFEGSSGFTITGGTFTSVAGNSYNNYSNAGPYHPQPPPPSGAPPAGPYRDLSGNYIVSGGAMHIDRQIQGRGPPLALPAAPHHAASTPPPQGAQAYGPGFTGRQRAAPARASPATGASRYAGLPAPDPYEHTEYASHTPYQEAYSQRYGSEDRSYSQSSAYGATGQYGSPAATCYQQSPPAGHPNPSWQGSYGRGSDQGYNGGARQIYDVESVGRSMQRMNLDEAPDNADRRQPRATEEAMDDESSSEDSEAAPDSAPGSLFSKFRRMGKGKKKAKKNRAEDPAQ